MELKLELNAISDAFTGGALESVQSVAQGKAQEAAKQLKTLSGSIDTGSLSNALSNFGGSNNASFLKGEVPNPNYEREDVNQFSQISEFTNDVLVYGTLYADIFAKDIDFGDEVEFFDLKVKNNFSVGGISTFYGPDKYGLSYRIPTT